MIRLREARHRARAAVELRVRVWVSGLLLWVVLWVCGLGLLLLLVMGAGKARLRHRARRRRGSGHLVPLRPRHRRIRRRRAREVRVAALVLRGIGIRALLMLLLVLGGIGIQVLLRPGTEAALELRARGGGLGGGKRAEGPEGVEALLRREGLCLCRRLGEVFEDAPPHPHARHLLHIEGAIRFAREVHLVSLRLRLLSPMIVARVEGRAVLVDVHRLLDF
ncbi:hypothetical protein B0H11DRAFT_2036561 [Mycena galericulata]|nr:hypothetical protein B0H11DRAFT_2036561 [Mycena galericulata]